MVTRFFRKYLSIIFIVATFVAVFHHHDDLKLHSDCQICTIQSNISNIDTPIDVIYLSHVEQYSEKTPDKLFNLHENQEKSTLQARAPPKIS